MSRSDELAELISRHAAELGEHFDSVQIIATIQNSDESEVDTSMSSGSGSLYARLAATREWVITQDEYVRAKARSDWKS